MRFVLANPGQRLAVGSGREAIQTRVSFGSKLYLVRVFADVDRRPAEIVTAYRTMKEFSRVVLTRDMAEHGLRSGDIGTIVHAYGEAEAVEVEFFTAAGDTIAVVTVEAADVRLPAPDEVLHIRRA